jgi:outer membrane protein
MIRFFSTLLLLCFVQYTSAQKKYSLEDCYRLGKERNNTLKQAENQIAADLLDRKTAQYRILPSFSYNIGHYFSYGKNIDPVTNTFINESFSGGYTAVNLQLNLFSGFSRMNAIKQSTYNIQSSAYAKIKAELEVLSNITLIYARMSLDKEQMEVQQSNMQSTDKQLEVVNEKIKVGRLSKYESYTFTARLNSERADLITIQNSFAAGAQQLKQLLNFHYKEELDIMPIDSTVLSDINKTDISAGDLIEVLLQIHPAVRQAQMEEQVSRLGVKVAKSSLLPTLSVSGNIASNYNGGQRSFAGQKIPLSTQLNNNVGQNIFLNLRIPVFSQMQNVNQVKKEKINFSNAQLAFQEAQNTVISNTLQLVNDFKAAREKYKATQSALEQNSLSYTLYEEKYKLGQISSVELLTAKDILNASTTKYLQAKLELYFRYQLIELLRKLK